MFAGRNKPRAGHQTTSSTVIELWLAGAIVEEQKDARNVKLAILEEFVKVCTWGVSLSAIVLLFAASKYMTRLNITLTCDIYS